MSERGVGKPWTPYEDNLLIQAVAVHGENDNWKAVALSVPGRTNKACRKRWLHSLSPNVKKTAWTPEEDQLLLSLYAVHGTKWSVIARHIPGRTDDACSKRYREALDPALKRDEWTSEEDAKLLEAHARLGGKWGLIGQELSRSGLGCRNRWRMLERKRVAASRDNAARGDATAQTAASTSQWTPGHAPAQDAQSWDGRSPQYVNPSMLMHNSPAHSQECRTPAYLPEQILSGAHLADCSAAASPAHQPFQYGSSALGGGLSHPGSVAHSPNPHHEYYASVGRYSPPVSPVGGPTPHAQVRQSSPGEFVPPGIDAHTVPGTTQHAVDHRALHLNPDAQGQHESSPSSSASRPRLPDDDGHAVVPDTPASPSAAGSPLPADSRSPSPPAENGGVRSALNDTNGTRSHYRTDAEKAQLSTASPRRPPNPERPSRLSSLLPATSDASVLAYACGHRECWPADADSSKSAFATSKELSDHSKLAHGGDLGGSKPFRCALKGCEKSWKSINGLQYHLQISKVHFQQALAARQTLPSDRGPPPPHAATSPSQAPTAEGPSPLASTHAPTPTPPEAPEPASDSAGVPPERGTGKDKDGEKPRRKLHPCPHPGCGKQYKQLSGLRYHLSHGHAEELPMQLDVVPPTLARLVAEKGRAGAVRG
ncbi:hypothetical protein PYCCODRAFT_1383880 [Trametes coccinea BRFM310]|uniref:C2H2-type domain-containing protein n=1 Tax=Trametes coccinea (strain BRFM310) TaxID=1353009 RepID=A0A1Y2IXU0_TRAC3|nr:hypothetical protein PYCCODRAFT_1383880 [Trametes coccinea BRFM310]